MITAQDHILIERFIEGTLTGIELKEFQERMTGDDSFRSEVEFYYLVFSGIRLSRERELANYITSNVSVRHYTPRSVIAIVIVMLIIVVSGVGVWNYLEKDATSENKNFFTFDFFNKLSMKPGTITGSSRQKADKKNTIEEKAALKADSLESSRAAAQANDDSASANYAQPHSKDSTLEDENIVIKKDELISSIEILVVNKSADQKTEAERAKESLTREAVEKLNPGAQLPEPEKAHNNMMQVEFWQSPVNYKGFKLIKNKLILFGIDRPEAVKLYSLNNQLYMQYEKLLSKLNPTEEYQSFMALRESEIPVQLK